MISIPLKEDSGFMVIDLAHLAMSISPSRKHVCLIWPVNKASSSVCDAWACFASERFGHIFRFNGTFITSDMSDASSSVVQDASFPILSVFP